MSIVEMAARWLVKRYNRDQCTFCYCPGCGLELCNSQSWYADPSSDLVRYECVQCGKRSGWLFDIPVPMLVEGGIPK